MHVNKGNGIVVATLGTYLLLFVERIFNSNQPTRDGIPNIYGERIISESLFDSVDVTCNRQSRKL